ncbi:MAG TPA: transporter [Clostridiales bacterium]|nr:transporter [Clostridiales bacterium]
MDKAPVFRYEQKYKITSYQMDELKQALSHLLQPDPHAQANGGYMIRSMYFDDMYQSAYLEKVDGVYHRKKYRIRVYDCGDRVINLECKNKHGPYIFKESARLTRAEYEGILQGDVDFLLHREEPMAREFFLDYRTKLLRPKVIVDYDREPYILDAGTVRITFDREIRAVQVGESLFDPAAPSYTVYPPGEEILEIKFTGYLPEFVRRIFQVRNYTQVSASKYCLCVDRLREIGRGE